MKGERRMTDKEIATLAAWVEGGTPEGDPKDAPPVKQFTDGWTLGPPDLILEPKEEMIVGASGGDLFRCFVLPTNLKEDKFVVAYEVRPTPDADDGRKADILEVEIESGHIRPIAATAATESHSGGHCPPSDCSRPGASSRCRRSAFARSSRREV